MGGAMTISTFSFPTTIHFGTGARDLVARHLDDVGVRRPRVVAAQGALAFQKGLGCVHSLSHSLGGVNPKLHHGTLNAMFLPAVVQFNASAGSIVKERRLARMAHAMGLGSCDAEGQSIADAIRAMNAKLGLPSGLAALGVTRGLYDRIIDGAMADHCHKTNPRLASREDYVRMLDASM
jgi:alcohol dehydrogenase class IV